MSGDPILSVRDVQVSFPTGGMLTRSSILGVAGVSLEIRRGETFALVGESGSGKTTLARAVNGLQTISEGEIAFEGQRIDTLSRAAMKPLRRRMSMMFQDPVGSLSPRMTVGDLVTEPFRIHGIEGRDLRAETDAPPVAGRPHARLRLAVPASAVRRAGAARGRGPGHRARPRTRDRR
jgi:ABC-type microcin C transport system duplicated ATPase subunit YejF